MSEGPKGEPKCEKVSVMGAQKWQVEYISQACARSSQRATRRLSTYTAVSVLVLMFRVTAGILRLNSVKNTRVFFNSVLATCEIVNCKKAYVNIRGKCPSVSIDNTDGATVYISQESLDGKIEFTTSKSSEMNLQWEKEKTLLRSPFLSSTSTIENGSVTVAVSDLYA